MRFSTIAAVCAAPLALASSLQADLVARGAVVAEAKPGENKGGNGGTSVSVQQQAGVSQTEIIIIWVNNGGGAATSTVAQTTTVAGKPAASQQTHQVTVGGTGGFAYTPDTIQAAVGDMVIFTFLAQNHSVTQAAFTTPCQKLANGMDSGFMPNANGSVVPPPQMAMQVTVATPLWFYCRQKGHCGKGMTLSINPTANKTQAMFQAMAISQNGTGTPAVIAGGSPGAAPPPPPAATTVSMATNTAAAGGAIQSSNAGSMSNTGSMASGSGTFQAGGACECSCLCGVNSFPSAAQGIGAFGGMPGSMPMSALEIPPASS